MDLEAKKPLRRVWNAFLGRPQPDGFRDVVSKYSLDVERISPVHGVGLAQGQATLMRAQAEDLLKGGTARARTLQGRAREGELPSRGKASTIKGTRRLLVGCPAPAADPESGCNGIGRDSKNGCQRRLFR
jgi:hypothetical protein